MTNEPQNGYNTNNFDQQSLNTQPVIQLQTAMQASPKGRSNIKNVGKKFLNNPFIVKFLNLEKKKKIALIGVSIFLILLIFVGSFAYMNSIPKEPVVQKPVEINFWGQSIDELVMKDIVTGFEAENPLIKVKYEKQTETNYKERIQTRLIAKDPTKLPDLVEINESWIDETPGVFQKINNEKVISRYLKLNQLLKNNTINSNLVGIPYNFDALALAFNVDQINNENITEESLSQQSWSSLLIKSKTLSRYKDVKVPNSTKSTQEVLRSGIAIGAPEKITNSGEIIALLAIQNEANIYDSKTKKFKVDSNFKQVLDFYTNFSANNIWTDSLGTQNEAFATGKVSLALMRVKDINTVVEKSPRLNFKTILPGKINRIQNISLGTSLVIPSAKTSNVPQVNRFVEYLTRTENSLALFNSKNKIKFLPPQDEALTKIPKESPYSIYSDIAPTAEKFPAPYFEKVIDVFNNFLARTYTVNSTRQQSNQFEYNLSSLDKSLNDILKPTSTTIPSTK